ncbi:MULTISPECIES: DUF6779 domain-containing protein [Dietzia]|uniref:DUF6779 domain-containing protein n=1 Tax=Dietzia TaxID=37914 RepID=UPI001C1FA9DE|nr:DUF6779 domain-containing protein [Dietzia sp. WMMA184]
MSSDGAMDKPRSARPARGDDRGLANIALGVLLLLAIIATVVMVFSDNPVWMRIGTLSALWAAFIGAFLVARYRRQAATEAARVRDLHTVYELQLEREISARREHELVVERDLRASVRAETSDSIVALRQEIAALREQLGALGVSLPEDRFAVGGLGPAGQLGAGSSLPSVPSERVAPRRRAPGSDSGPVAGPRSASGATRSPASSASGVGPDVTPSTERTERLTPVSDRESRSDTPAGDPRRPAVRPTSGARDARSAAGSSSGFGSGATSRPQARPEPASSPEPARTPANTSTSTSSRPAASAVEGATSDKTAALGPPVASGGAAASGSSEKAGKHESPTPSEKAGKHESPATAGETATQPRSQSTQAPAAESASPSRHGEGSGLSVAELMARLGEGFESTSGRRRRRAED